ncbi:M23 family metallopeptidase [Granulicella sp. WH15]|uniref:M23 family metallopeptidase n=1 Tax=Granulicella sp. WH15 TaxID=2602070 RepID=UPI001366F98E|nr:M23 family metallopeptidase [Granulicella sp. WH15]QHN02398.1 M23 family metallopeptidase [Granulicella sp. WH15]
MPANPKKRFYILFVSRDTDGNLHKVPVPLRYAYLFVAAAVIGMFTITGMAGSYSRMLIKTARFNQLRADHNSLQKDYAHLEKQAHEKDIQAASLGSLASEVSALYGLTTSKLAAVNRGRTTKGAKPVVVDAAKSAGTAPLADISETNVASLADDSYTKSLDAFYTLRSNAMSGDTSRFLATPVDTPLGGMLHPLGRGREFGGLDSGLDVADSPSLWPVTGPITSSFGQREDPVLGNGEGEFHPGIDISAVQGTPIHVTADGVVQSAEFVNGYGRMVAVDHGHGLVTMYGHMSGFAVTAGQQVSRGQVIGYVGHSGRTTGNHVHYEVRIRNTPVNPHKYLRQTLAQLGGGLPGAQ